MVCCGGVLCAVFGGDVHFVVCSMQCVKWGGYLKCAFCGAFVECAMCGGVVQCAACGV